MDKLKHYFIKIEPWFKSLSILVILLIIGKILPDKTLDQWQIINFKKIVNLICALSFIQVLSQVLIIALGHRDGMKISGFLGGLVSSTAMTFKLSKQSQGLNKQETFNKSIVFLSSTLAMLVEAISFVFVGVDSKDYKIIIIFVGPLIMTFFLMSRWKNKSTHTNAVKIEKPYDLKFSSSIELTLLIVGIISLSKILKNLYGQNGLIAMTMIISLFEIHGSIISNIQFFTQKVINLDVIGLLISISILSSYLSKIGIIYSIGNKFLRKIVLLWSFQIIISLFLSWLLFSLFIK